MGILENKEGLISVQDYKASTDIDKSMGMLENKEGRISLGKSKNKKECSLQHPTPHPI